MADEKDDIEKNIRSDIEQAKKNEIERDQAQKSAAEEKIKETKIREKIDERKPKEYEESLEKRSRELQQGAASRVGASLHESNAWLWPGLIKHFGIDGLLASVLGYGAWSEAWYSTEFAMTISMVMLFTYWLLYLRRKHSGSGLGSYARTFVPCAIIFLFDTFIMQKLISNFIIPVVPELSIWIFGVLYIRPVWFPWWSILYILTSNTKMAQMFRTLYIILILVLAVEAGLQGGMPEILASATSQLQSAQSAKEAAEKRSDYWKVNWDRIYDCLIKDNTAACKLIGKPTIAETQKAITEETILQGGVDDKLIQDIVLKLTASRNAPVNYWERQITASGVLEASTYTGDVIIDLSCGLKVDKEYVASSGEISPKTVTVKYLNLLGASESVSCLMTKAHALKKGINSVYFKAKIERQLELDSYLIAYFIKEEDLLSETSFYLNKDPSIKKRYLDLRSAKGITEAQKDLYAHLFKDILSTDYPSGKVESKSEVGFIKTVITLNNIPIVGIKQGIRNGVVELPSWLVPVKDGCSILDLDSPEQKAGRTSYRLNEKILNSVKWEDVQYQTINQKKLAPCTLETKGDPNDPAILFNPSTLNPKIISLKVGYDYEIETTGSLEVRDADISKAEILDPNLGILKQVPIEAAEWQNITDNFGLPGYNNRPREGIVIYAPEGTAIHSVSSGVVSARGCVDWGGNFVIVTEPGLHEIMYAHLKSISKRKGDPINQNEIIGEVGTTASCRKVDADQSQCDDQTELCGEANKVKPQLHFGVYSYEGGMPLKPYCAVRKLYDPSYQCGVT